MRQQNGQAVSVRGFSRLFVLFVAYILILALVLAWFHSILILEALGKIGWSLEANHIADFSNGETVLAQQNRGLL